MDQDGAAWGEGIAFTVDFDSMSIVYEGGFCAPIIAMFDRFDDETDDPDEAEEILVEMPGEGLVVALYVDDLVAERVSPDDASN
ncbi:hypothetical protein [Bradyrhizobium sp. SZCCHNRI2010]|uniref:hypothetical protein n=1 Tax=Bradyrhizobium sp. SZCCHNRI2010 TaxID=3057283 RepID=UPI0028E8525F|nr:hypothetical protein [Bradyrhizobium sp. SZCCHNRI2010]